MARQQSATPTGNTRRGARAVHPAVLCSTNFDVFFRCDQVRKCPNVVRVEAVNIWEAEDKAWTYAGHHDLTGFKVDAVVTALPPRRVPLRIPRAVKLTLRVARNVLAVLGVCFVVLLGLGFMQYQDRVAAGDTSCTLTHCV
ncbi:hypothetical protein PQQ59_06095 [Paraburkholderia aspalathi]|uniref:hypothetical protein n=1 Tax=Paraburkholderia aspalathi TaxID=1324617 RepID=UPI0038BAE7C9